MRAAVARIDAVWIVVRENIRVVAAAEVLPGSRDELVEFHGSRCHLGARAATEQQPLCPRGNRKVQRQFRVVVHHDLQLAIGGRLAVVDHCCRADDGRSADGF